MLVVKVYPDLYSPHMTQVYSGLYELAREGRINLEITSQFDYRIRKSQRNSVLCVQVFDSENDRKRTVCFDMFDGCEISSIERLKLSDVYFKRSYYDKYIGDIDVLQRGKIFPYGLNFECRTRNERNILKRLFIYHLASNTFSRNPTSFLKHFVTEVIAHLCLRYDIRTSGFRPMSVDDFVVQPDEPAEPKILFQTRLWTARECPRISEDRLKSINETRANTIRSLRTRFGNQFVGGLIPTEYARQLFPDCCLSANEAKRRNYVKLVKNCLICVTTAGLHDSIGFKLPEYLAASRCIVTEPLKFRLPVPLIEGTNYLSFSTPEQCVKACERLLADPQLVEHMRRKNYRYYMNEVNPPALIYKRLKAAMSLQETVGQTAVA